METKISKDILDNSGVADYVKERVPWVQYMDSLPEDTTELLQKTPIGGIIITNEEPPIASEKKFVQYVASLPEDPDELAALEASIPDGGLLIVENED